MSGTDPAVELLDSRQDLRWVVSAMEPAERRELLDRVGRWLTWLMDEYDDDGLREKVPPCWYRHKSGRNQLIALYVGWVRSYVEPGDNQRELALIEWHDALDRVSKRLTFAAKCLEAGEHVEPTYNQRDPWRTDPGYAVWAGTGPEMTRDPFHPAPYYAARPKPQPGTAAPPRATKTAPAPRAAATPPPAAGPGPAPRAAAESLAARTPLTLTVAEMDPLVSSGVARLLPSGAVRHGDAWWIRHDGAYVRLLPDNPDHLTLIEDLDARASQ